MAKIYGTIMELNPFHNGHQYFLEQFLKIANGQSTVIVISGNYVQRGELSCLSKTTKAKILTDLGIDLVLELPFVFANQGADYFAYHAVKILQSVGVTDLVFGSETGDINLLKTMQYNFQYSTYKQGKNSNLGAFQANDILGISYLKAVEKLKASIDVHLVKRVKPSENITSASAIRKLHLQNHDITPFLQADVEANLLDTSFANQTLISTAYLNLTYALNAQLSIKLAENNQLLKRLLEIYLKNQDKEQLFAAFEMQESSGIYNLATWAELAADKNNSKYKYQRILLNLVFLIEDQNYDSPYLRPLAFSPAGQKLLKGQAVILSLKHTTNNPVVDVELRATALYNLLVIDYSNQQTNMFQAKINELLPPQKR
ncbi:MAG: nucleotidyltransferase family protein [Mycoplasmatales bacterium]